MGSPPLTMIVCSGGDELRRRRNTQLSQRVTTVSAIALALFAALAGSASASPPERIAMAAAAPNEVTQDKLWLQLLGYLDDDVDEQPGATYREAIRDFQSQNSFEPTGRLKPNQRQRLQELARAEERTAGYTWLRDPVTGIELRVPVRLAPPAGGSTQNGQPAGSLWRSRDDLLRIETFKFPLLGQPVKQQLAAISRQFAPGERLWEQAPGTTPNDPRLAIETRNGQRYILLKLYVGANDIRAVRVAYDVRQKAKFNAVMNVVGESILAYPPPSELPQMGSKPKPPARANATAPVAPVAPVVPVVPPKPAPSRDAVADAVPPAPAAAKPTPAPPPAPPAVTKPAPPVLLNPPATAPVATPAVQPPAARPAKARFGSGFIINASGQAVTNYHVIRGCRAVTVFSGGAEWTAKVRQTDPATDLAVLDVQGLKERTPLSLARSESTIAVNTVVVALGFAGAEPLPDSLKAVAATVSKPIDSINSARMLFTIPPVPAAPGQAPGGQGKGGAFKPEQSGGPLLDQFGRVVGLVNLQTPASSGLAADPAIAIRADALATFLKAANVPFTTQATGFIGRSVPTVVEEAKAAMVQISCEPVVPGSAN
jgi:S1-C subfamily serine protease